MPRPQSAASMPGSATPTDDGSDHDRDDEELDSEVDEDTTGFTREFSSTASKSVHSAATSAGKHQRLATTTPWSTWMEWRRVRAQLWSLDPLERRKGLDTVNKWGVFRGKVPMPMKTTCSLIDASDAGSDEKARLALSLAVVRAVNLAVEAMQRGEFAQSVSGLAERLGLEKWIVDVRHQAAHGTSLPSIQILRMAAARLLTWLNQSYWSIQEQLIVESEENDARVGSSMDDDSLSKLDPFDEESVRTLVRLDPRAAAKKLMQGFGTCLESAEEESKLTSWEKLLKSLDASGIFASECGLEHALLMAASSDLKDLDSIGRLALICDFLTSRAWNRSVALAKKKASATRRGGGSTAKWSSSSGRAAETASPSEMTSSLKRGLIRVAEASVARACEPETDEMSREMLLSGVLPFCGLPESVIESLSEACREVAAGANAEFPIRTGESELEKAFPPKWKRVSELEALTTRATKARRLNAEVDNTQRLVESAYHGSGAGVEYIEEHEREQRFAEKAWTPEDHEAMKKEIRLWS